MSSASGCGSNTQTFDIVVFFEPLFRRRRDGRDQCRPDVRRVARDARNGREDG